MSRTYDWSKADLKTGKDNAFAAGHLAKREYQKYLESQGYNPA